MDYFHFQPVIDIVKLMYRKRVPVVASDPLNFVPFVSFASVIVVPPSLNCARTVNPEAPRLNEVTCAKWTEIEPAGITKGSPDIITSPDGSVTDPAVCI